MENNAKDFHRRSIRLHDYDYAQTGAYFVTICTQQRNLFFENPLIREIAERCWQEIPSHFPTVELDEWVVMPNYVHGILVLGVAQNSKFNENGSYFSTISPHANTLAVIIRAFKAAVTKLCLRSHEIEFAWQRNYYERIIRNENDLNRIRQYILDNPSKWDEDEENPKREQRPV